MGLAMPAGACCKFLWGVERAVPEYAAPERQVPARASSVTNEAMKSTRAILAIGSCLV